MADADVLIQNMKWQDLALMDLLPHNLQARFPRLVHVRLIGSEFDPDRLAYDVVVQAEAVSCPRTVTRCDRQQGFQSL